MSERVVAGRYRILRPLGAGGMGSVFVARQEPLGREVALKLLRHVTGPHQQEHAERFRREAAALARLSNPHVLTVFDYGFDDDGAPFLATELVEGLSLRERLRQGPLSEDDTLRLLRAVGRGLQAAHQAGLVHRDLKPANIVLPGGDPGAAKILDFGLVKQGTHIDDGATLDAISLTGDRILVGTPGYIAPEYAVDGVSDDPRSDLYALGVVAYECLAGAQPFDAPTPVGLVMAHAMKPRPVVSDNVTVSDSTAVLVNRLLAIHPDERVQSADDLLAVLDAPASLAPSSSSSPRAASRVRPPVRAAGIALGLLLLFGVGLGLAWWLAAPAGTQRARAGSSARPVRVGFWQGQGHWRVDSGTFSVRRSIFRRLLGETLVRRNADHTLAGGALGSFSLDESQRHLDLRLRPGAAFAPHPTCFPAGRPATAQDLVASLALAAEELAALRVVVEHAAVTGPDRVDVTLRHPNAQALAALREVLLIPAELTADGACDDPTHLAHPAGSGPYRLVDDQDDRIVLAPRDASAGLVPLTYVRVADPADCLAGLVRDRVDYCDVPFPAAAAFVTRSGPDLTLRAPWAERLEGVAFGERLGLGRYRWQLMLPAVGAGSPLAAAETRRLLSAALDRGPLCTAYGFQTSQTTSTPLPSFLWAAAVPAPAAPDVEVARRGLAQAVRRAGRPLKLGSLNNHKGIELMCAQLREAAIPCTHVPLPSGDLAQSLADGVVDAVPVALVDSLRDPFVRLTTLLGYLEARGAPHPGLAAQVAAIDEEVKPERRRGLLEALVEQIAEQMPYIAMCMRPPDAHEAAVFTRAGLGGVFDDVTRRVWARAPESNVPPATVHWGD